MLVDDELLLDLFHRLEADERPQRAAFRFVLALLVLFVLTALMFSI